MLEPSHGIELSTYTLQHATSINEEVTPGSAAGQNPEVTPTRRRAVRS